MNEKIFKKENIVVGGASLVLFLGMIIISHSAILGLVLALIGTITLFYYILKNPFFGMTLIIFFLPFERFPTFNLGGVDVRINLILGFLTLLSWLMLTLIDSKRQKIQPSGIGLPLSVFVIAMLVSLAQALDLSRALQVLVFIIFVMVLSVMTVNLVCSEERLKKIIQILFFSTALVGIFGIFQFFGDKIGLSQSVTLLKNGYTSIVFGFPRIQAFSMEPLYLANLLLIPLSLILAYLIEGYNIFSRRYLWIIFVLLGFNFIFTSSRGAYLGFIFSILVFVIYYFKRIFTWTNIIIIISIASILFSIGWVISSGNYGTSTRFVQHITLQDSANSDSVFGRIGSIQYAQGIYWRYPVLGIGIGNFGPYAANYPAVTPGGGWGIANNEYFEILAEMGIVGLVAFLLVFAALIWRSVIALKKASNPFLRATLIGLFAAFVGAIVQYNFFSTLYIIHIWILIGLLIVAQNLILFKKDI